MQNLLIGLGLILFIAFGIFQLVIGYQGIEHHIGSIWAGIAIVCALVFRFTLPITIGTYFGVVDVLEWHWALALVIALPGFLFMAPTLILGIFEPILSKISKKS